MWAIGIVVALLTTALLIVNLYPKIWKGLLEERNLTLIAIGVSVTAIIVLLAIGGTSLGWTGFGDKTFWDWLQLLSALAIPVVLAAAGLWFTAQQDARQQNIENQRADAERELAEQRAQDEALQAYLNQMSELILNRNLLEAKGSDPVYTLAQARTSTVMSGLDAAHNRSVVRFLSNSGLLGSSRLQDPPLSTGSLLRGIGLEGVDLSGLRTEGCISSACRPEDLLGAGLRNADLSNADLSNDDLFLADLRGADLSGADLTNASLSGADLSGQKRTAIAPASGANLSRANLNDAFLLGADLTNATVRSADLSGAYLKNAYLKNAYLSGADLTNANVKAADLSGADLRDADLSKALLHNANLTNASLRGADLSGADLSDANLRYASGVSKETLEKQASDLEGASMPTGKNATTVFEPAFAFSADWGISTEGREKIDEVTIASEAGRYYELTFTNPSHVFAPSNPSEEKELPAPENAEEWVSWFQRHPSLDISEPVSVRVGGLSGKQIDVEASSTREVPLYSSIYAAPSDEGLKDRYVIVDVGGQTVVINASAPTDEADTFFQKAQKFFDTVEWKSE